MSTLNFFQRSCILNINRQVEHKVDVWVYIYLLAPKVIELILYGSIRFVVRNGRSKEFGLLLT